jgi:hypothetical protein
VTITVIHQDQTAEAIPPAPTMVIIRQAPVLDLVPMPAPDLTIAAVTNAIAVASHLTSSSLLAPLDPVFAPLETVALFR